MKHHINQFTQYYQLQNFYNVLFYITFLVKRVNQSTDETKQCQY